MPGEVRQRPDQPVDFVDDDDVDPAGPYFGQEFLQGREVEGDTGEGAIVIMGGDEPPNRSKR